MSELELELSSRMEEESLFARDIDGHLVRMDQVTSDDLTKEITIKVDGHEVTVRKAVPATDAQGNIRRDAQGRPIPRATTIYDAASKLYRDQLDQPNPIPVLCHQEHIDPVAVCRLCSVEICKLKRGQIQRERKLLPACQHRVEETMEVHTLNSPDKAAVERIKGPVKILTELLVGDHLTKQQIVDLAATAGAGSGDPADHRGNELIALAERLEIATPRFPARAVHRGPEHARRESNGKPAGVDDSSFAIRVDHDSCILCDRCVRGCDDVKKNFIIGRAGKGYTAHVSFDLDDPMGRSNCVSCGECMINCPTDALTFKNPVRHSDEDDEPAEHGVHREILSAAEVKKYELFRGVSYKFLEWNTGSVKRRKVRAGDVLCRQGNPGSTAFIIISGEYEVLVRPPASLEKKEQSGWGKFLGKITTRAKGGPADELRCVDMMTKDNLIVGEMTCMSHYPRSATIRARTEGEVLEINRNVLYYLQRDRAARALLDRTYRKNALSNHLRKAPLFQQLDEATRKACIDFLRDRVDLVRVDPGQEIFRQGERADHFYLVRLGFVKVTQAQGGQSRVADYMGPGRSFGEIGLLSQIGEIAAEHFPAGLPPGVRTATCTALDDVELVRIRGEDFRKLLEISPVAAEQLVEYAKTLLKVDGDVRRNVDRPLDEFLSQGLFEAQRLLVLDLECCTRCDECTRACSDTHQGVTRLIREGLRFDRFLVASSCRSCLDPYCLVGCPVDAIHRRPRDKSEQSLEIVIEDHCIGCTLCASNCPYGNINMHPRDERSPEKGVHATTCDLCRDVVPASGKTSCVYACPHNAAFRMSGDDLFKLVHPAAQTGA